MKHTTHRYVHHIDLYRLPQDSDLRIIGIPAIFLETICLIEWPQRMQSKDFPTAYLDVRISIQRSDEDKESVVDVDEDNANDGQTRLVHCKVVGDKWKSKMSQINEYLREDNDDDLID